MITFWHFCHCPTLRLRHDIGELIEPREPHPGKQPTAVGTHLVVVERWYERQTDLHPVGLALPGKPPQVAHHHAVGEAGVAAIGGQVGFLYVYNIAVNIWQQPLHMTAGNVQGCLEGDIPLLRGYLAELLDELAAHGRLARQ